jgi:phosphate acetyltransferase
MDPIDVFKQSVRGRGKVVVFPEGSDERILRAARRIADDDIARPCVLGTKKDIQRNAASLGVPLDKITVVDNRTSSALKSYASAYLKGRPKANPKVAARLIKKPLFYASMMTRCGDADVMVAGAGCATARVIEAGLMGVGLAQGIETPSSFFLMVVPDFQGREKALIFADCAVNVEPTPSQLADIAVASADSAKRLLFEAPRVALLSFSTKGSAKHSRVGKVIEALKIIRQRAPGLAVDGELQADAALIASVAATKVKGESDVAGKANVLVFPDLDAGNIAYKLTQYLAKARAVGPVLQGFAKPVSDLSRGASIDDIVSATVIALAQAGPEVQTR